MAKFLSELELKCSQANENYWFLDAPLLYKSDLLTDPLSSADTGIITIPSGFCCDLASTRHIPGVSFIWGSTAHREGVLHDYLYRIDSAPVVSFAMANSIFIEAMECRGKKWWVKYPMFWGVWIGGYFSYHEKKVDWKPTEEKK